LYFCTSKVPVKQVNCVPVMGRNIEIFIIYIYIYIYVNIHSCEAARNIKRVLEIEFASFFIIHVPRYTVSCTGHSAYVSIRQHMSAYVSIRQHTSAYVSIRQHTSAYVSIPVRGTPLPSRRDQVRFISAHQLIISIRTLTYADVC
jgi:hypothetical protein